VLGGIFIVLSIVMAAIAGATREPTKIDTSLANSAAPLQNTTTAPPPGRSAPPPPSGAPQNQSAPAVPLAQ
jgi:preprotein translocase subunit SecG